MIFLFSRPNNPSLLSFSSQLLHLSSFLSFELNFPLLITTSASHCTDWYRILANNFPVNWEKQIAFWVVYRGILVFLHSMAWVLVSFFACLWFAVLFWVVGLRVFFSPHNSLIWMLYVQLYLWLVLHIFFSVKLRDLSNSFTLCSRSSLFHIGCIVPVLLLQSTWVTLNSHHSLWRVRDLSSLIFAFTFIRHLSPSLCSQTKFIRLMLWLT